MWIERLYDFEFLEIYMEKLSIAICVSFYNNNSKKYQESKENIDTMVIISSGLEIFRRQNTKDSKNDMELWYKLQ